MTGKVVRIIRESVGTRIIAKAEKVSSSGDIIPPEKAIEVVTRARGNETLVEKKRKTKKGKCQYITFITNGLPRVNNLIKLMAMSKEEGITSTEEPGNPILRFLYSKKVC